MKLDRFCNAVMMFFLLLFDFVCASTLSIFSTHASSPSATSIQSVYTLLSIP